MRRIVFYSTLAMIFMIGGRFEYLTANGTLEPNAVFYGSQYQERVGYVLSGAGDINGDGLDDFIIGTFHHSTGGYDAGCVYLILGRAEADYGMSFDLNNADAIFLGALLEAVGFHIAGRGDINGDGYDDILIGAPAGNDQVAYKPGRLYIVFGRPDAVWGTNCYLFEKADAIYDGENAQDLAARTVAFIGDLNKDGCDEFLIAAPYNDDGGRDAGKVYLIRGKREGWSRSAKLKFEPTTFYYPEDWARCGYAVAGLGDVNSDGTPDFAISARGSKKIFIIFCRESINWGSKFNLANADVILTPENILKEEECGWHVEGVGDVNGDFISDILISAIDYDKFGRNPGRGKVYLVLGRGQNWGQKEISLYYSDASYIGVERGDQAGWGIGGGGDINNDGLNDFFIGAWYNDYGFEDAGSGYLIHGKRSGWENNINLGTLPYFFSGVDSVNYAGYAVTIPGDIDGDEMDDYIMSAPYNSDVNKWSGKIYLFASQRGRYVITGNVYYHHSNYPVPNTVVTISKKDRDTKITDYNGAYDFEVFGKEDYYLFALKPDNSDIGEEAVTEYDAALIAQASIGLDRFDRETERCADVNLDGRVTAYDAAVVLKYSLDLSTPSDSHVGEWLFLPDTLVIPYIENDMSNANFEGMIRGDVNASWAGTSALSRAAVSAIELHREQDEDQYVLCMRAAENSSMLSFAVSLEYGPEELRFNRIERGDIGDLFTIEHNTTKSGNLRVAGFSAQSVTRGGDLIKIIFDKRAANVDDDDIVLNMVRVNDDRVTTRIPALNDVGEGTFELLQNYPNPFNGSTEIRYRLGQPGLVELNIYDTLGRTVYQTKERVAGVGTHAITWDAKDVSGAPVATGIYVARLTFHGSSQVIKLMYLK